MASLVPPQPPLSWPQSPEEVQRIVDEIIEKDKKSINNIAALRPDECTFESVFLALAEAEGEFDRVREPVRFLQEVSPLEQMRDATNKAAEKAAEYKIDVSMRVDLFAAKQAAQKNIELSGKKLGPEELRLVEMMIKDGIRAGLALPESQREELEKLRKELSNACSEYKKNITEEKGSISFTLEELGGVPENAVSGYTKHAEDGKELYRVSFKYPDMGPISEFADSPGTRQRMWEASSSRLEINVPVLERILDLRRKIASLLGYETWADYVTEINVAKTAKNVATFLEEFEQNLRPQALKDRKVLLPMKEEDCKTRGLPFDGKYYAWDTGYYRGKWIKDSLDLDDSLVKEYFPVSHVIPTVLEIYENLLGVKFIEVKGELWHPDVQRYALWNKDAQTDSDFLGYCYLDLFTREGKYGGASTWTLVSGYDHPDGSRSYPETGLIANLTKPSSDKPATIRHGDLTLFFHEMGHIFHNLCSHTRFARFHGTISPVDFAEAPSQMLENWCWDPRVLAKMSSHVETKEPLPADLIDKLVKSRHKKDISMFFGMLFFAAYDIKVHTDKEPSDYTKLWNEMRERILMTSSMKPVPAQTAMAYLADGYDAGVYAYAYSLMFATDMFVTVFKEDPLDPQRGKLYREKILRPGASQDELKTLEDFLGRPPSSKAFYKEFLGEDN